MATPYEQARLDLMDAFERHGGALGVPVNGRRILGYLFFTARRASLDAIAADLGVAKSGVSVNVRALDGLGLVRRVRVAGESRRDYYEAHLTTVAAYALAVDRAVAAHLAPLHDAFARAEATLAASAEGTAAAERLARERRGREPLFALLAQFKEALAYLRSKQEAGEI
jgi:DNA-binding transcriptional regulator GbsR (MarR family)